MNIEVFKDYYNCFISNRKYILIFLLALCVFTVAMFTSENWQYPNFEFGSIVLVAILGIFLILYGFKNRNNLHNVAFVAIIIFGILMVLVTPPFIFPDEGTHFTRAEYITEGVLIPHETPNGFLINDYYFILNSFRFGGTVFENPQVFNPIGNTTGYWEFCTQTPFYAHIFSAIGIFLAKCLDLATIWALWLARLGNLIFYAFIARFSIKKVPVYKMPMFVMACLPLLIGGVSSVSYDAFVFTLGFLAVAYFIYMFKEKVENKDLFIFFCSVLLIALIKPPYIILALLIFFVPSKNFASKRFKWFMLVPFACILGITLIFTFDIFGFNSSAILYSNLTNYSPHDQFNYLLSSPMNVLNFFVVSLKSFVGLFVSDLTFFHYADYKGIKYYNLFYLIFFIVFSLLYPLKIKLSQNKRIFMILMLILFYFAMYFLIYLEWNTVGSSVILGVQGRYFVPILPLVPLAINYPFKEIKNIDLYTITFVIIFLAGLFLLPITHYY